MNDKEPQRIWKDGLTKAEFAEYIMNYPRKLNPDTYGVCEPAEISYNDFEFGYWPDTKVAAFYAYDDEPNSPRYGTEKDKNYRVIVNAEEIYNYIKEHGKTDRERECRERKEKEKTNDIKELYEKSRDIPVKITFLRRESE